MAGPVKFVIGAVIAGILGLMAILIFSSLGSVSTLQMNIAISTINALILAGAVSILGLFLFIVGLSGID